MQVKFLNHAEAASGATARSSSLVVSLVTKRGMSIQDRSARDSQKPDLDATQRGIVVACVGDGLASVSSAGKVSALSGRLALRSSV
jgi:hypothetical protein